MRVHTAHSNWIISLRNLINIFNFSVERLFGGEERQDAWFCELWLRAFPIWCENWMPFCHFYQFDAAHSTLDFTNYAKHNVYTIELECNVVNIIIICTTQYTLVWTNVIRRRNRSKKSTANKQHITQTRSKYFILIWKIFSKSFSKSADCWSTRNKTEFYEKYKNNHHNDWNEMKWNEIMLFCPASAFIGFIHFFRRVLNGQFGWVRLFVVALRICDGTQRQNQSEIFDLALQTFIWFY